MFASLFLDTQCVCFAVSEHFELSAAENMNFASTFFCLQEMLACFLLLILNIYALFFCNAVIVKIKLWLLIKDHKQDHLMKQDQILFKDYWTSKKWILGNKNQSVCRGELNLNFSSTHTVPSFFFIQLHMDASRAYRCWCTSSFFTEEEYKWTDEI